MLQFKPLNGVGEAVMWRALGELPEFARTDDSTPLSEQLDANYRHGGGWRHFNGFALYGDNTIKYPGDAPLKPFAVAEFRDQKVFAYPGPWILIKEPDGSFEICRMD